MQTVTSNDGATIAFDRSGAGPAIILVGGALSERSAGIPLATRLAPHFTVYAYDRRRRGDSGDTQPYEVEREIEDIAALMQEAGGSAFVRPRLGRHSGCFASERSVDGPASPGSRSSVTSRTAPTSSPWR